MKPRHRRGKNCALGAFLARVGLALRNFVQPDPRTDHVWDLQRLPGTRAMTVRIADPKLRLRVELAYDDFERHAGSVLNSLRTQAVHNDMNPYNVVVNRGTRAWSGASLTLGTWPTLPWHAMLQSEPRIAGR